MKARATPSARVEVKVSTRAARDQLGGWMGKLLKVRVRAAPRDGLANAALEALLARVLGVAPGRVRVIRGHGSTRKLVEIEGIEQGELTRRLPAR